VVAEKRASVRWGSNVCETRLMMRNEEAPGGRLTKKPATHMLRAGVGEKGQFS
jgi:hypothetical protein